MVEYIVVVDAFSTGKYLAPRLQEMGYSCIHVQTFRNLPKIFRNPSHLEYFTKKIVEPDDRSELLNSLKKYPIRCVIPGTETGVDLADYLSESLGVISNGTQNSLARFNKYAMIDLLSKSGIKTAKYLLAQSIDEILKWVKEKNIHPVVLKPVQSAANDKVYFCASTQEIVNAFNKIKENKNIFDKENTSVLAQSFLEGDEYIVNTASANGIHYIAEVWKCRKEKVSGGKNISLLETLEFENSSKIKILSDYAISVLNVLKIQHGPGHLEIMYTKTGPILIEIAARMQGCVDPFAVETALGDSHVSVTIDSYLNPESIIQRTKHQYRIHQYIYRVFLISHVSGILKNDPDISILKNLPSYFSHTLNLKKGDVVNKTTDLASSLGYMHLVGENQQQLEDDYQKYRDMEREKLIKV